MQDTRTGTILGHGTEQGGSYYVDETVKTGHSLLVHGTPIQQLWTRHRHLGHPSLGYLKRLFPSFHSCNLSLDCETCVLAKSHKHSYSPSFTRTDRPFDLIHSDVWGPAPESNSQGYSYVVLFLDDCTRVSWIYFLKHKSEVFDGFVNFYNMILTQFHTRLKILRSDNGGEYVSHKMKSFILEHSIIHQTTCPDTPQQNGVAERKNRSLLNISRALMFESHVPASYWPEAISTANYLSNRLPTKSLEFRTPLATLESFHPIPSSHSLPPRIFGCVVYVHLPKRDRTKLEPRAAKCVFLGYGVGQKGYRCFDPLHNKLYTTMDCDFFEHSYFFTQPRSQGESTSEDLSWLIYLLTNGRDPKEQIDDTTVTVTETTVPLPTQSTAVPEYPAEQEVIPNSPDTDTNDVISSDDVPRRYELPPRSTRGIPPRRYDPEFESQRSRYPIQENQGNLSQVAVAFNTSLYSCSLPKSTDDALRDPKWKKAMEEEILALKRNETWERCILPKEKRVVGCKWVFSIKYHANGTIERYKARLVQKDTLKPLE